jgi:hypothetical protein
LRKPVWFLVIELVADAVLTATSSAAASAAAAAQRALRMLAAIERNDGRPQRATVCAWKLAGRGAERC